jgi:multidrug efflux pump subunit AcrA (membrane-fusion protein)
MATNNERQAQKTVVQAIQTAKVAKGALEKRVRITGVTAARNYANIIAPILRGPESNRPMVLLKLVAGGAVVKQGDELATIDGQAALDHIDDTRDTVEAAVSDIKKRKAEQELDMENLQQTLRAAKAEAEKAKLEASASEVRTEVERMLLELAVDEADARHKQLERDVPEYVKRQKAELRILEITLGRHQRHLDRHLSDYKKFVIRTPINGLAVRQSVYLGRGQMRQVDEGDQVYPGLQFMKVVDTSSMQVEGVANQTGLNDLRIGQKATISLDAFPGLTFPGTVHTIGALAVGSWRQNFYIRNIPIKIHIEGNDPRLIPDLSASADILVDRQEDSVLTPLNALRVQDGKTTVEVKKGAGFETREVKVGLRTDTQAAILSGLSAGEEVRLF